MTLKSERRQVMLGTNASKVADGVGGTKQGDTLQAAVEKGATDERQTDTTQLVGVLNIIEPVQVMYFVGLAGEALNAQGVREARQLELEYFRQMDVYDRVPTQTLRGGGQAARCVMGG